MDKTITKVELIEIINDQMGCTKIEARDYLETFLESIKSTLASGESLKISGFGNFVVRHKPDRPGRNPQTGETITITQRQVISFKASALLRRKLLTDQ